MTKLHLIRGGKVHHGGRKGPPPPGGPPGSHGRRRGGGRRPNPLNLLLWYATSHAHYNARAESTEIIAERMTRISQRFMGRRINVSTSNASATIFDARRRRRFYGWTLMHVEKGGHGFNRGYIPVLMDTDDQDYEIFVLNADDINHVIAGLNSSVATVESMVANEADGMSFFIGCLEALTMRAEADRFREFAAECRAFARRAAEVRQHAENL